MFYQFHFQFICFLVQIQFDFFVGKMVQIYLGISIFFAWVFRQVLNKQSSKSSIIAIEILTHLFRLLFDSWHNLISWFFVDTRFERLRICTTITLKGKGLLKKGNSYQYTKMINLNSTRFNLIINRCLYAWLDSMGVCFMTLVVRTWGSEFKAHLKQFAMNDFIALFMDQIGDLFRTPFFSTFFLVPHTRP